MTRAVPEQDDPELSGRPVLPAAPAASAASAALPYWAPSWLRGRVRPTRLRPDHVVRQFIRFALVGGSSNVVYAGAFTVLAAWGYLVANVVGVVLSTALANELHRRLTFNAAERVSWWSAQWEGGALGLVGLVMSSLTLGVLHVWFPGAAPFTQVLLVIGVSAAVGVLRFVALRGWVFTPHRQAADA